MPVLQPGAGTPTVSVQVPVPTPVQSKKPRPSGPVSFGGEQPPTAPVQPVQGRQPVPPMPRQMSAVVLPWSPEPSRKSRRGVIRYGAETNEDDFHRMLDANPEDHHTRMVFADWLQERGDPRASGYRALGMLRKAPQMFVPRLGGVPVHRWSGYGLRETMPPRAIRASKSHDLPRDWTDAIENSALTYPTLPPWLTAHRTRREAEDAAALAFSKIHPERQREILHKLQPQQMGRLPRKRVRFAKPGSQADRSVLFPEEVSAMEGSRESTLKDMDAAIRQGMSNKPGMMPGVGELKALAQVGEPVKGGYKGQQSGVEKLLGPEDARRWVVINGILSPQSAWVEHTAGAFEALAHWHLKGRPTQARALDRIFGTTGLNEDGRVIWNKDGLFTGPRTTSGVKIEKIKRYLAGELPDAVRWQDVAGAESWKVPNFSLAYYDHRGVPIDTHMARLLVPGGDWTRGRLMKLAAGVGADQKTLKALKEIRDNIVTNKAVHLAYKSLIGKAAQELGWEPREVQEAVWVATVGVIVARHLGADPDADQILSKLNTHALQAGWDLDTVLASPEVQNDLRKLGVKPRALTGVRKGLQPTGKPRRPRTGDPAALESAAVRIGGPVPDAGYPIRDKLLTSRLRARKLYTPARYSKQEHEAFQRAIRTGDLTARKVYADFLEERGQATPQTLEFLRNNEDPAWVSHGPDGKVHAGRRWTMQEIRDHMQAQGSHWFSPDTMAFFNTRLHGEPLHGPMGVAFVSSEVPPHSGRRYTVRLFRPAGEGQSAMISSFVPGGHPSHLAARTVARRIVFNQPVDRASPTQMAGDFAGVPHTYPTPPTENPE